MRADGRAQDEIRPVRITTGYMSYADGSVLIETGRTRVICAVSIEERVPPFLKGKGMGWITAEYSMLPRSTITRTPREMGGRNHEIRRFIGRSLRAAFDLYLIGERTLIVDCDVLQADGGTRTASVTGAFVALYEAFLKMRERGEIKIIPIKNLIAATSVGIVDGIPMLDLCYEEDVRADVDLNVVMTERGEFVEIQGTAEGRPFSKGEMEELLSLAERGIREIMEHQRRAIKELEASYRASPSDSDL